ncbi:hypothetical protein OEZ85_008361 [Tetradesmus obliquus]|uniref:Uncharacterized protein n=1 Tax=Tetradesmus obliquus TaxID=3088 RepID=A0ABY8TJ50_TETOB|nr:hypothetical protein OEZ85_008361 [Tetradesmus obliquus]
MAYIAKAYESNWSYARDGSDFNSKVGTLLSGGADLQATSVAAALAATKCPVPAAAQHQAGDVNANPYHKSTSSKTCIGPHPGYAWVDKHGQPLAVGPPAAAAADSSAASSTTGQQQQQHINSSSSNSCAGVDNGTMTSTQRSMVIWKRISPGMLPGTSATPQSTTAEAYAYPAGLAEAPDATHHLKKTDFSEYTEAALRHMHHLHQAKK